MTNELQLAEVHQGDMEKARLWILRGDPSKYGKITLHDFFPYPEELEKVGIFPESIYPEFKRGESIQ